MAKKLWQTEKDAINAIERGLRGIEIIVDQYRKKLCNPKIADAVGSALYRNIRIICEGMLYLVCSVKADVNGTLDFPQMKDLNKNGDAVDATTEAKLAAKGICDMKRPFDDGPVTPDMLRLLMEVAYVFIQWTHDELIKYEGLIPNYYRWFRGLKEMMNEALSSGVSDDYYQGRLDFRYVGDVDLDSMTDEEIDELYRPKKTNNRKSIASLFIYLILKENTDWDHHYHISDILAKLESEYELTMDRKAVGRYLQNLAEEDKANIWVSSRDGYWYSERRPDYYE